ncbi:hypothetical protein GMORB2_1323 [Geosmithia morbida]|uniref:Amino acid permease/ SLC12A domain-containing protein n=1 Tax=Geosmithia morbida TaxID=1094350 RepID=A0A9P5D4I4_9HYPO|nr:uncharacterized protein GMORB2_1323 [Geosmithia morbida]KAF4126077.1 hypothetical protein GMORB2_1323 [Geosmithia morbida]
MASRSNSAASRDTPHNGITYTRDFEVIEMANMAAAADASTGDDREHQQNHDNHTRGGSRRNSKSRPPEFWMPSSYMVSTGQPDDFNDDVKKSSVKHWIDSFRQASPAASLNSVTLGGNVEAESRFYDLRAANARTSHTALARELKGRHLQMIAIGGSIGTGLFVASGLALNRGGPISLLLAYSAIGAVQFCTVQALGELVVSFPVAGSFSALTTRFLDPSWGFAMGWNYALQWLVTLPLEIIAASLTTDYWNHGLDNAIFVTIFLCGIVVINMFGVKGYGEAEFLFSIIKVTAVVGFILLGIVINIGGTPTSGYIGAKYWRDPGVFNNGFRGFCSVLVTAAFSFAGTELIGLAAAETANPRKSLPSAIKKVFWRITIFYIVTLLLVGLLVPYDEPRLLGGTSSVDARASPFVIAIESAGVAVLPGVMNAVILIAVISVGNSSVFGSSRTLAALAEQSQAPRLLAYVDREGRPLLSIIATLSVGLLAYLADVENHGVIFDWLLAISGLSSLFTWISICLCHIRFRAAWKAAGHADHEIPFRSQVGLAGSWIALVGYVLVLASQIWLGVSPIPTAADGSTRQGDVKGGSSQVGQDAFSPGEIAQNFFLDIMALPIVLIFWAGHKLWFRTSVVKIEDMDIDTGRRYSRLRAKPDSEEDHKRSWPLWKRAYHFMF